MTESKFSLSGSLGGDGVDTSTIIAIVAAAVSFIVAIINGIAAYYRDKQTQQELWAAERRFEQFKKDLEDRQRRLVRFENVQELMKQYKKPLLQSAFDLQSRISNQVKQNFLHVFIHQRNSERDSSYARYNFAFVIAEFLGWLEVIRQEIVFISGQEDSVLLSALVDAIKFQFTGETPVQGVPMKGKEDDPQFDKNSSLLQLYAGELRAIGEVMIRDRGEGDSVLLISAPNNQNLQVIGYAEFMRRMTKEGPPEGSDPELIDAWETVERHLQESLSPLLMHVDRLATLPKGEAPTHRLAILQVLLCRLVDMLDAAVPWDCGRKYDLEAGEEPQYVPRDFRITPLVAYLNEQQKKWLATQPFMESADWWVDDPTGEWEERMQEVDPMYRKLCFCGFREDLASKSQEEREKGPDMWPGCFPPRAPRTRPLHWYWENGLAPPPWMVAQAPEARGLRRLFKWGSAKVADEAGLRQRRGRGGASIGKGEGADEEAGKTDPSVVVVGGRTHSIAPGGRAHSTLGGRSAVSMGAMQRTPSVLVPSGSVNAAAVAAAGSMGGGGGVMFAPLPPPTAPMVVQTSLARADTLKSRDKGALLAAVMSAKEADKEDKDKDSAKDSSSSASGSGKHDADEVVEGEGGDSRGSSASGNEQEPQLPGATEPVAVRGSHDGPANADLPISDAPAVVASVGGARRASGSEGTTPILKGVLKGALKAPAAVEPAEGEGAAKAGPVAEGRMWLPGQMPA